MKKWVVFFFILSLVFPSYVSASNGPFSVTVKTNYIILENGETQIRENVSITNNKPYMYVPAYILETGFDDLTKVAVYRSGSQLPFVIEKSKNGSKINVEFANRTVGIGAKNIFTVEFTTKQIVKNKGSIREIVIPGLSNPKDFVDYSATVTIPQSFGIPGVIKPQIANKQGPYSFSKSQLEKSGVNMIFGDAQYYLAKISYQISNPNLFPISTEIALPPNTSYQEVIIDSLKPEPENVNQDGDGNWLATYKLAAQEKKNIQLTQYIKTFTTPRIEPLVNPTRYFLNQTFWDTNSIKVKKAASLVTGSPAIYDFVTTSLSYNYKKGSNSNLRLGASRTLEKPNQVSSLEFTDLFVTLARINKIPARSVEGFIYTTNANLGQKTNEDILHAWPEYYNSEKKSWIMVDPTLGNITGGVDYFNTFDFDHIAFVIRGLNSMYPVPAGVYKNKGTNRDINITFAASDRFKRRKEFIIADNIPKSSFSFLPFMARFKIKNTGNILISPDRLKIRIDGNNSEIRVPAIPPYGVAEVKVRLPGNSVLTNKTKQITISYGEKKYAKDLKIRTIPYEVGIFVGGAFFVTIIVILTITTQSWRVSIRK